MSRRNGFVLGQCYSRKHISRTLGGGTQDYLPHKNLHVVCGCFRPDLNPHAPFEVLPGTRADIRRWSEVFQSQIEAMPIFLKRAPNRWEYQGLWRFASAVNDRRTLEQKRKEAHRTAISIVLRLDKISD